VEVRGGARIVATDGLERFEWRAPNAKWVAVAGDFNGWYLGQFRLVKQPDGLWIAYLPIKRPFSYKFIIDGLWKIDADRAVQRVPNNFGEYNSFRPAQVVTSPSSATIEREVVAGDMRALDIITSYATSGDYGCAVAWARRVAEVNAAALGTTSPLVLRALDLEASIHKRWNRLDDAAACWQRLAEASVETTETARAIAELAAYYLYVKADKAAGKQLNEIAMARAPNNVELVRAIVRWLYLEFQEGRVEETLATLDQLLARLPQPNMDKQYAGELTELWLLKGAAHNRLKQTDRARQAFEKVIEVSPWTDSQNAQNARHWLETHGFGSTSKQ
jgi:hypothetical protein